VSHEETIAKFAAELAQLKHRTEFLYR
jgi:hypothetical protein